VRVKKSCIRQLTRVDPLRNDMRLLIRSFIIIIIILYVIRMLPGSLTSGFISLFSTRTTERYYIILTMTSTPPNDLNLALLKLLPNKTLLKQK